MKTTLALVALLLPAIANAQSQGEINQLIEQAHAINAAKGIAQPPTMVDTMNSMFKAQQEMQDRAWVEQLQRNQFAHEDQIVNTVTGRFYGQEGPRR